MRKSILFVAAALILASCGARQSQAEENGMEQKSGLSAVRLIGPKSTLEEMAKAAAKVRWAEHHYDAKGRLILPVPPNYDPDDFGRLLNAIGPYTEHLQGLQMLGPNGGPVDDKGIEHSDD